MTEKTRKGKPLLNRRELTEIARAPGYRARTTDYDTSGKRGNYASCDYWNWDEGDSPSWDSVTYWTRIEGITSAQIKNLRGLDLKISRKTWRYAEPSDKPEYTVKLMGGFVINMENVNSDTGNVALETYGPENEGFLKELFDRARKTYAGGRRRGREISPNVLEKILKAAKDVGDKVKLGEYKWRTR